MSVPSVFGLPHLSEDAVAAFADGVLSAGAAARAARHCQECPECAEAVWGQREAALMLRSAMAPSLPSGLLDRLAGLPMSTELPPPTSGLPTALGPNGHPVLIAYRPSQPSGIDPDQLAQESVEDDDRHRHAWQVSRRAVLPIGLIASAAAVVAAGTLGAQVQSSTGVPNTAANLSGVVTQTQDQNQVSGRTGSQPLRPASGVRRNLPVGYAPQAVGSWTAAAGPVVSHSAGRRIAQP
jgi:anti-sigma factor RsiW